jgi:hypothetical protein
MKKICARSSRVNPQRHYKQKKKYEKKYELGKENSCKDKTIKGMESANKF